MTRFWGVAALALKSSVVGDGTSDLLQDGCILNCKERCGVFRALALSMRMMNKDLKQRIDRSSCLPLVLNFDDRSAVEGVASIGGSV